MNKHPYYKATINGLDCNFILFVNDVPLLKFTKGANINTDLNINTFLQESNNQLRCEIKPLQGQEQIADTARAKIAVFWITDFEVQDKKEVAAFQTPSFKVTEENLPKQSFILEGKFDVDIPFHSVLPAGKVMTMDPSLKTELFTKYEKLWLLLKSKDIAAVIHEFALKNKEYAMMMDETVKDLEEEMKTDYTGYVNDATLELWEFTLDKVFLKVYNYGRLVCLEVKNGNQPLCFINRKDKIAIYIPVYFYRNPANNELTIIR